MPTIRPFSAGLLALGLCVASSSAQAPPASSHLPAEPWVVVEWRQASHALRALAAHPTWAEVWTAALQLSPDGGAGLQKLKFVEGVLERASSIAALPALGELLGDRALAWVEGPDQWVIEIAPSDPRLVARVLLELDRLAPWLPTVPRLVPFDFEGAPAWSYGENLHVLRSGDHFLISARRDLVEQAARRGSATREARSKQEALPTRTAAPGATVWIAGSLVRSSDGVEKLPAELRQPMTQLLVGSYLAPLLVARPLQIELGWDETYSKLHAEVELGDAQHIDPYWRELIEPPATTVPVPSFATAPHLLARMRLQRDWARWWRDKGERWSEEGRAGIRELEQLLALLLKGEDFADALADLEGPVELFLVEPQFQDPAVPAHQYPAAALVIGLRSAPRGEIFERAFRTLLGISNIERLKLGFSPLQVESSTAEGFQVIRAAWDAEALERTRVEGNLSPAFARCDHNVVLASSSQALDAALQVLRTTPHQSLAPSLSSLPRCESIEVDGEALARLLKINREALVFARALEEGESLTVAEQRIDALLVLAEAVRSASFSMVLDRDRARATFDIEVRGARR